MKLVCVQGATGEGGAVFAVPTISTKGSINVNKLSVLLVGDTAVCPSHNIPEPSTIIEGSPKLQVDGIPVAVTGSKTSCGHAINYPGPNEILSVND